jgi:hypothetical protein
LVQRLLTAQQPDGSWPAAAFCLDPVRDGVTYYDGSESLTTALALESLQLYSQPTRSLTKTRKRGPGIAFQTQVLAAVRRNCRSLEPELQSEMLSFVNRLAASSNGPEIIGLPLKFNHSLLEPLPRTAHPLLTKLGAANLYGWMAYTIYDDFLDEEGRPALLPVATAALRYSLAAFAQALPGDMAFQRLVRKTFDTIDGANAWEISHCRWQLSEDQLVVRELPDYGDVTRLAERSMGYALTPLAVLCAGGVELNSKSLRGVRQAMVHYLTARQLNDDAHDWQVDLANGHITYVVARLLADEGVRSGRQRLRPLVKRLQRRFWHQTLPELCQAMQTQTALSRDSLRGLPGLQPSNVITDLLDGIEASIADTLGAQAQAQSFLKYYKRRLVRAA